MWDDLWPPYFFVISECLHSIRVITLETKQIKLYLWVLLNEKSEWEFAENAMSTDVIKMLEFLINNIFVIFSGRVFQQTIGILMGTNGSWLSPFGIFNLFQPSNPVSSTSSNHQIQSDCKDRHGRDCMVVGFTTTYAISAYHH